MGLSIMPIIQLIKGWLEGAKMKVFKRKAYEFHDAKYRILKV